jgi:NitT/TauT family transport system substrate-binding protein
MRNIILVLAVFSAAVFSSGAAGSQDKIDRPAPESVKIALLNGPSGIGLIRLKSEPVFSDPEVKADVQIMGAPKVLLGQMLKEEWDAAILPSTMASVLYNKGIAYRCAAVTGMGNLSLVGRKDAGLDSLRDLESLTLHIPGKNTTPDLITQLIAGKRNLNLNLDYSFNPSDLAKALAGGVVKAAVLPEPLVSIALKSSDDLEILYDMQTLWKDSFKEGREYPLTVLVLRKSFVENWPGLAREILDAAGESLAWVKDNPAEASALIGEHGFTLPAPIVKQAIPRSNYVFLEGKEMSMAVTPYFERVAELNPASLGGRVPADEFYYSR